MKKITHFVFIWLLILAFSLTGCSTQTGTEENWEESPTMIREMVVTDKGEKEDIIYRIGNNGKLIVQEVPYIAGKPNKYFWMFWGDKETLTKPVKIVGTSKESGESLTVFEIPQGQPLASLYGADHTMPSSIKLPSAGLWRLEVYFGDELFGNVVVNVQEENKSKGVADDWKVRTEYIKNGKVLFAVFPDPTLSAGKPAGYMISFKESFETFKGKKITIYVYHKETGKRVTALSPQTISEPSPGYPSLNRFTTNFTLPLSGLWRYEVVLNDQIYGDVILSVNEPKPDNTEWKVSPLFKSGAYTMIGQEGRLGFIYDDLEVSRFYPHKVQKYMWHFWGKPEELKGKLKVVGVSKETGEQITVFETQALGGANNGADAHTPSGMSLPSSGLWRLDAYIREKYFGSVVVQVHERK